MRRYGEIARFRVGPPRLGFEFDVVFTPEGAHQVLARNADHYAKGSPVFTEFEYVLGQGLLTSNGERWRRHRRIVAPLMTRRRLEVHLDTIAAAAADLVRWCEQDVAAGRPVDLHGTSMRYALHVLGSAVFGEDITAAAPVLRDALPALSQHAARRGLAPVRSPHWWPSVANRRAAACRRRVWDLADELIAKRAQSTGNGSDLLGLLLAARDPETGEGLTHREVRDEALIFLIAGHETTGSGLAFTLQLLGRHPAVQERVRDEVQRVSNASADPRLDLESLPFTAKVVREAMRLYSPAHTVIRQAVKDTEVLGHPVPAGGIVAVSIWGIHRQPALWPDPDRFAPDRFDDEDGQADPGTRSRYAHLSFGGGPRSCIGEHLALTELVVAVAAVVRRFRVEALLATPPTEVDITLRPHGVLPARLEPVDG